MNIEPIPGAPQMPPSYPYDYDRSLNGVGGWLIIVIIGLILTAVIGIRDIFDSLSVMGKASSLDSLLWLAIVMDVLVYIALSIVILIFMFTRKIIFRLLYVIQVVVILLSNLLVKIYMSNLGYDVATTGFLNSIVSAVIWIAYLYKSKRVKNTYIYSYIYYGQGQTL